MKKQAADAKQRAANDKPNGNGKAKAVKPRPVDEKYTVGSTETVKRGFLKEFCDFARKKGTVDAAALISEFSGRQIDGHKIDAARVHRYIRYAINHGQLKVAK
ncbi:MAG: hypothetical protein WAN17_16720 [Candidatus Sulfotelmatobacter sp.]